MSVEIEADATGAAPLAAPAQAFPSESPSAEASSPFTMVTDAAGAMVCEGDVCYVPGLSAE
ncbi:hypothetical protein [Agromyces sp. S2-1-8]|uniref:hypothetical protein n=1 Tax=Agromyces sp. S2-1-8 TaxID=2897180 RepID=UPI001E5946BD|nr:hypothetical protein [Agromyces sp. S2-1-8]MCD5347294.1 hypothetical protein [Agromyces sp. S2-1-8]